MAELREGPVSSPAAGTPGEHDRTADRSGWPSSVGSRQRETASPPHP